MAPMGPSYDEPGCTCDAGGERPECLHHGYEAVIARLEAEVALLRGALSDLANYVETGRWGGSSSHPLARAREALNG